MPPITSTMTNAERRAFLVARFEGRLRELWPDETPGGRVPFSDFDDLEMKATVLGDETTRETMQSALERAMQLGAAEKPGHCEQCGRKLQYSHKTKTTETIRGPVRAERDYAYCRGCRRGFFPR